MSSDPTAGGTRLSGIKGVLFACVGKPSAGKSTFLNAISEGQAKAKVGNFPFTTIGSADLFFLQSEPGRHHDPNRGIAFYQIDCPCKKHGVSSQCRPRYGSCEDGIRKVPIQVLDVAGLVPGAHEGRGLGNRFLDDLRSAAVLVHVVDVSGTTNEKGEATQGYDPTADVRWLVEEIELWVYGNLHRSWASLVRRASLTRARADETLQQQLSGYGVKLPVVQATLAALEREGPPHTPLQIAFQTPLQGNPLHDLGTWDDTLLRTFVSTFVRLRFPFILALNKIDLKDSDRNIAHLLDQYGEDNVVLCSALAELYLVQMREKGYIAYRGGDDHFLLQGEPMAPPYLTPASDKVRERLERIRSLLFRYGSTGCAEVIRRVISRQTLGPVFPVASLVKFTASDDPRSEEGAFRDCILLPEGSAVRKVAPALGLQGTVTFAVTLDGHQMGPGEVINDRNNIMKLTLAKKEQ